MFNAFRILSVVLVLSSQTTSLAEDLNSVLQIASEKLQSKPWVLSYHNARFGLDDSQKESWKTEIETCFENGLTFEKAIVKIRCPISGDRDIGYKIYTDKNKVMIIQFSESLKGENVSASYIFDMNVLRGTSFSIVDRNFDQTKEKDYFVFESKN